MSSVFWVLRFEYCVLPKPPLSPHSMCVNRVDSSRPSYPHTLRYAARWYSVLLRREYWADSKGSEWNPQLWDCMLAFTGGNDEKRPGPWDEDNADCLLDLCCAYVTLQRKALEDCEDVNAGLMLLLSQRSMGAVDVRIPPPPVSELIAEASRVRGVRQRTETHNEIKTGISRAVKGFFGSIARRSSLASSDDRIDSEGSAVGPPAPPLERRPSGLSGQSRDRPRSTPTPSPGPTAASEEAHAAVNKPTAEV